MNGEILKPVINGDHYPTLKYLSRNLTFFFPAPKAVLRDCVYKVIRSRVTTARIYNTFACRIDVSLL